jgi:hypothetical protein
MPICILCNVDKILTDFVKNAQYKSGFMTKCKLCDNSLRNKRRNERKEILVVDETKTKTCFDCKLSKNITSFTKSKACLDGYRNRCKECQNNIQRSKAELRTVPVDLVSKTCKTCKELKLIKNFSSNTAYKDSLEAECKICYRIKQNEYNSNPEIRKRINEWNKIWTKKPENKLKIKKNRRKRYKGYRNDIKFKILNALRRRISKFVSGKEKSAKTKELLGCSLEEFKEYIESQFKPGMTWADHKIDGFHLDHVRCCASFNLLKKTEQRICFNWRNFQPLPAIENLRKHAKYIFPKYKKDILKLPRIN